MNASHEDLLQKEEVVLEHQWYHKIVRIQLGAVCFLNLKTFLLKTSSKIWLAQRTTLRNA